MAHRLMTSAPRLAISQVLNDRLIISARVRGAIVINQRAPHSSSVARPTLRSLHSSSTPTQYERAGRRFYSRDAATKPGNEMDVQTSRNIPWLFRNSLRTDSAGNLLDFGVPFQPNFTEAKCRTLSGLTLVTMGVASGWTYWFFTCRRDEAARSFMYENFTMKLGGWQDFASRPWTIITSAFTCYEEFSYALAFVCRSELVVALTALTPLRFLGLFFGAAAAGCIAQSCEVGTHSSDLGEMSGSSAPFAVHGGNAAWMGIFTFNIFNMGARYTPGARPGSRLFLSSSLIGMPMLVHVVYRLGWPSATDLEREYNLARTKQAGNLGGALVGVLYYLKYVRRLPVPIR